MTQIIFWMMAATDGHAKNFSISIGPQGRYHLTPNYDVLSAWPVIGHGNNQISGRSANWRWPYVAVATITRYIEYNDATGSGMVR